MSRYTGDISFSSFGAIFMLKLWCVWSHVFVVDVFLQRRKNVVYGFLM